MYGDALRDCCRRRIGLLQTHSLQYPAPSLIKSKQIDKAPSDLSEVTAALP